MGDFFYLYAVLFRAEMRTALARGPLLLEHRVDVIHFAQPLEERQEVQELRVGHVVEPRGHRHLDENASHQHQRYFLDHDSGAVCFTHCVIGVEDVGGGGVVHDDDFV